MLAASTGTFCERVAASAGITRGREDSALPAEVIRELLAWLRARGAPSDVRVCDRAARVAVNGRWAPSVRSQTTRPH